MFLASKLLVMVVTSSPAAPMVASAAPVAQQGAEVDSTVIRARKVLDSLIPLRAPGELGAMDAKAWAEHTTWLKTVKARLENLLKMVVSPAKSVATYAPISAKNITALQTEAQTESRKLAITSAPLRARHEAAMTAIRNMKS